jgi:hypothetical protein
VCQRQAAFGHHLHHFSQAQLKPKIPSHAQDDDLKVKMRPCCTDQWCKRDDRSQDGQTHIQQCQSAFEDVTGVRDRSACAHRGYDDGGLREILVGGTSRARLF